MADPFDSTALFAEFNRPREASDRILMSNLKDNNQKKGSGRLDFGEPAERDSKTNKEGHLHFSSSSDDSSSSDEESETETGEKEDEDGPVEIGRDEAGCIMYRPGERERRVGLKLLQNADYGDGYDRPQEGDNGGDNRDELEKLRETNTMYRKQTRLIDPTRHIPADERADAPALQVLFMNHDFARKYRADIERFISDLIYRDMMDQPMRPVRERPHHVCVAEGAAHVKEQDTAYHEHRTSTVIGASRFYMDFVVDNMGFPLVDYIPALSDGWEIPRYEQQFVKVLPVGSDSEDDEDKPPPQKQGSMCFNCGGDHRLNECQEQRDFQRISANRNKFQAKSKQMSGTLNKGITGDSSKFSAFKPGVYSNALLEALGMQPNRLPFFVYRMRQLGYPPGYLMEAEVDRSGIAMFGKDGQVERSEQPIERQDTVSLEDGETNDGDDDKVVYNVDKLIDFPGFNVPLPEDIPDEGHRYGCPPMQPTQSKEYMQSNLPTPRGVKRQNARKEEHGGKRRRLVEDMDLDESGNEPGISGGSSCGSITRSDTPTLEDLEAQQRLLRQELGDDDSQGSAGTSRASSVDNTEGHRFTVPEPPGTPGGNPPLPHVPPPQTPPAPPLPPGTPPVTPKTPLSASTPGSDPFTTPINSLSANSSLNRSNSASIEKTMGTPVRKKCTEDLPTATQFRVGVQDHIPFENLPDAVGTYDKMKDVISQIRRLKKKSQ